jgi:hypothetical protein
MWMRLVLLRATHSKKAFMGWMLAGASSVKEEEEADGESSSIEFGFGFVSFFHGGY